MQPPYSTNSTSEYAIPVNDIPQAIPIQPYYQNQVINQIPPNYEYSAYPYPVATPVDNENEKQENGNDEKKKSTMAKIGSGIVNTYGMVSRAAGDVLTKITTKVIQKQKNNQRTDFSTLDHDYFHRNPQVPPLDYFDDTFVSMFEVHLSLELQMSFKETDQFLQEKCPAFTLDYLDPDYKFLVGSVYNMYVFCFRGTRSPNDVTVDLKAIPKPISIGSVHKGFYDRFNNVIQQFPIRSNISRILVTGHSLGGGAAQCGYLTLKLLYPHLSIVCVTFGCPCCVSQEIMLSIEEPREIVNFVDEGDYIPTITVEKFTKKKFNSLITEGEKRTDITLDDFIPYRKMFTAAVEELCHYHPMGVYYYLPLPLTKYTKHPLRCRTEEHFDALYESQFSRGVSSFGYHKVNTYFDRMYLYVFNPSSTWENFNYAIPWLDPEQYKLIVSKENE